MLNVTSMGTEEDNGKLQLSGDQLSAGKWQHVSSQAEGALKLGCCSSRITLIAAIILIGSPLL